MEKEKSTKKLNCLKLILKIAAVGMILFSVIILYLANSKMIFKMDDEWYATNLVTGVPLSGFADIFESQVWHFFHWGGRSVAHALLQLTLWAGPFAADCVNVAMTALLVVLICKLAGTRDVFHALLTFGLLFILNANWSQTMLWQSGAANYLYMTTIILGFLSFYFKALEQSAQGRVTSSGKCSALKNIGLTLLMIPLGLMAGWSNENMGPAVWVGTLAVMLLLWKREAVFHLWMLAGNLCCLLGSALLILAPGNAVRNAEAVTQTAGKGLLWRAFLRGFSMANGLFYYLFDACVLFLLLLFVYVFLLRQKLRDTDLLCTVMAVLSFGAMLLSPHYPDRAAFGTMVFLMEPIVHMFSEIQKSREDLRLPAYGVALFVWLAGMFPLCTYICQMIGWLE